MRRASARALGSILITTALFATACSSQSDTDSSSSAITAVSADDCPDGLISLVMDDEKSSLFAPNVAKTCVSLAKTQLDDPAQLESYLSKHPFVTLGQPADFVASCTDRWERTHKKLGPARLNPEQRTAVVGSYYYLLNTLKQAGLGTLEALAGLDLLINPGAAPLAEGDGQVYEHPLIHESGDWVRRLRWNCTGRPERFDELVDLTNAVLWGVRKLDAGAAEWRAQMDRSTASIVERNAAEIDKARDALVMGVAPWLRGREMKSLQSHTLSLAQMEEAEKRFDLVDAKGMLRPRDQWKAGADNPILIQEKEVRDGLRPQLIATRKELAAHLTEVFKTAEYLHGNQAGISQDEYQATLDKLAGFNPRVFGNFYETEEFTAAFSQEGLAALETSVHALASAHPAAKAPAWNDPAGLDVTQRLDQLEGVLAALQAGKVDVSLQLKRLQTMRAAREEAKNGISSQAKLSSAQCRSTMRSTRDAVESLQEDFVFGVALTITTAGMGSWMAAARLAPNLGAAADVGVGWSARASALSLQGVQKVASSGVSYEKQAKVLWGVFLGSNVYFGGQAVMDSILECNKLVKHQVIDLFDAPFNPKTQTCLQGVDPLAHQAVSNYRACAITAALSVGLNTLAFLPGANGTHPNPK